MACCPHDGLSQQSVHDVAVDIGEAVVPALEAEGELLVIHAEQVEDGGLEIVDVHLVTGDGEAELVGLAVNGAGLYSSAGHKHGVAVWVVVSAEHFAA